MKRRLLLTGLMLLLGAGLGGCAEPVGASRWGGPSYYDRSYAGPGYFAAPDYYPRYHRGSRYYADRHGAFPPPDRWTHRPEWRPRPRTEYWSQERLRQHWEEMRRRSCTPPGPGC